MDRSLWYARILRGRELREGTGAAAGGPQRNAESIELAVSAVAAVLIPGDLESATDNAQTRGFEADSGCSPERGGIDVERR